jgi:hypothetical protein
MKTPYVDFNLCRKSHRELTLTDAQAPQNDQAQAERGCERIQG